MTRDRRRIVAAAPRTRPPGEPSTAGALLTLEEASTLVGVSTRTLSRWIVAGHLAAWPDALHGRAKLYLARDVYEAERAART